MDQATNALYVVKRELDFLRWMYKQMCKDVPQVAMEARNRYQDETAWEVPEGY